MKKILTIITIASLAVTLGACGGSGSSGADKETAGTAAESTTTGETTTATVPETEPETKPEKTTLTVGEFEELLAAQPVYISDTEYLEGDSRYSSLYPDLLSAILVNSTDVDIKDAQVAFVAWDENHLPIKLKGNMDFNDAAYIKKINYSDINLAPGMSFGEKQGMTLDSGLNVDTFHAIVMSFETFEGDRWENPYYDAFKKLYEGQKYDEGATVEVKIVESDFTPSGDGAQSDSSAEVTDTILDELLAAEPLTVIETMYTVQDERYKSLYPDMLQAVIQNNSEADIKDAVVAFMGWDDNGLPVKIEGQFDFGDAKYVKEVNFTDINLTPGSTYGESSGYKLNESSTVTTVKAIAISYETFEGEKWSNPHYKDFKKLYEGQKLKSE